MPRVLVTGGRGFIGRHALPELVSLGWEVFSVTSSSDPPDISEVRWIGADLLDRNSSEKLVQQVGATHLLHLAWYCEHQKYWQSAENYRWVTASIDLLLAFHRAGGERAVIAGTCAEYDWSYGYCRELITPTAPSSVYGVCKDALRRLCEAYCSQNEIQFAWGRIFSPYGHGEHPSRLLPSVILNIARGQLAPCSHGEQYRDYLYVTDVAHAFCKLLTCEAGGVFNVSSGQPVRILELVQKVAEAFSRPELPQFGTVAASSDDPPLLVGDNEKLRSLGWSQLVSIDDGIAKCINEWAKK